MVINFIHLGTKHVDSLQVEMLQQIRGVVEYCETRDSHKLEHFHL